MDFNGLNELNSWEHPWIKFLECDCHIPNDAKIVLYSESIPLLSGMQQWSHPTPPLHHSTGSSKEVPGRTIPCEGTTGWPNPQIPPPNTEDQAGSQWALIL